MAQVLPHLYIGPYQAAASLADLHTLGITHIVNMTAEYDNLFPSQFTYLRIPARDTISERLGPCFLDIAAFVATAHKEDGKALIHCQEGISRSATGVLACLMVNERMRLADAMLRLKEVHPDVEPNLAFLRELRVLERSLFGECSTGKLTVLDTGGEVAADDLKESLAVLLALAGTHRVPFDPASRWCQPIWSEFHVALMNGVVEEIRPLVETAIVNGLDAYGGRSERDVRARDTLEALLSKGLVEQNICTQPELVEVLFALSESETMQELYIDVPEARTWVKDVLNRLGNVR